MKRCLFRRKGFYRLLGILCLPISLWILIPAGVRADSTPSILWEQFGLNGGGGNSVAVGPDGHPVVAGEDCPGGDESPSTCVPRTTKYHGATGDVLWSINTSFYGVGGSVAIGPDGNPVIAVGVANDASNFYDIRLVKYDATTGVPLWGDGGNPPSVSFVGAAPWYNSVGVGPDGSPVVAGTSIDITSGYNIVIAKYSGATGALLWTATFDSGATDVERAIAVGPDNNPVVTGAYCGPLADTCDDIRTIKFDGTTGAQLWTSVFGLAGSDDNGQGVAIGADGHPVVTGYSFAYGACRTIKYDKTTGAEIWNIMSVGDTCTAVAIGPDGHPVIAGYQNWMIKYQGATGAQVWVIETGGAFYFGVAVGSDCNPVVTGRLGPNGGGWRTIKYSVPGPCDAPPVVGTITSIPAAAGGSVLIATGSSVPFSAPWTDVNLLDTHTAQCNVLDVFGTTPNTSVSGTAPGSGSGTATCNVTFGTTGIFSVSLTVTDQDGASGTSTAIQVVVYDPSAGFVTGGGWFTPDPQTCVCTPGGKATFGLVARYQRGSSVPTGVQEFQYKVDNINLHSTSFDWLVVSGPQAQFQGTGTINGAGAYKFRVTVRDGDLIGQPDRFEIRILPGGSTDFGGVHLWKGGNDLTGSNGAGSIVIHH